MIYRFWKTPEVRIVREMYATHTAEDIGRLIDRTPRAVVHRAGIEGLRKPIEFFRASTMKRYT